MNPLLTEGLRITLIGMSLVFAALCLLWGLMALLACDLTPLRPGSRRVTAETAVLAEASATEPAKQPTEQELAAIAMAISLLKAEQEAEAALPWRLPPVLTRWLAIGYGRQLHSWQPRRTKRDV